MIVPSAEQLKERLTRALMDTWVRHKETRPGEWGKPDNVYFSVEKAVDALVPVAQSLLDTLSQELERLKEQNEALDLARQSIFRNNLELAAALTALREERETVVRTRFVCPVCGPVSVQDDGTCVSCGADTDVKAVEIPLLTRRASEGDSPRQPAAPTDEALSQNTGIA